jgi:hypothetical protein
LGSFCFVHAYKRATDSQGNARSTSWALSNAAGTRYLAELMLNEEDPSRVWIVVNTSRGVMMLDARTSHLCTLNSLAAFCEDLRRAKGFLVSPEKLRNPASTYASQYEAQY